MLSAKLIC